MTPDEFRGIRLDLDLSQRELGVHLERSGELIKKIEAGTARITEKIEQALLELAENPPVREHNAAPRRGRPLGHANRPSAWQEDDWQEADDKAGEGMIVLAFAVMAIVALVMLALVWLLGRGSDVHAPPAPA